MVGLAAYFDDSEKSGIATFAGFISDADQWKRFDIEWSEMLEKEELPFFHTVDCYRRKKLCEEWDINRSIRALKRAMAIIHFRVRYAISFSVNIPDFHTVVTTPEMKEFFGNPLSFCVAGCLREVENWKERYKISDPIAYMFEKGAKYGKGTSNLINLISRTAYKKRFNMSEPWQFAEKLHNSPLQAADVIAYTMAQYSLAEKNKEPLDQPLMDIVTELQKMPNSMWYVDCGFLNSLWEKDGQGDPVK